MTGGDFDFSDHPDQLVLKIICSAEPHAFYSSQITSFISEIANMPSRTYMLSANILHSKDNEIFPRLNNSNSLLAVHQILV